MQYKVYPPGPLLARYVKCYWSLEGGHVTAERVFPDGCMELVFHYGEAFTRTNAAGESNTQPAAFVHGQLKSFIDLSATGKTGVFSVRFQPAGLKAFTPVDAHELTGHNVAVADIWGKKGAVLEDQIVSAGSNNARVAIITGFLLQQLALRATALTPEEYCVQSILRANGNINIDQLAASVYLGRRHMERRLTASVGLNPKLLARIIRFRSTLVALEQQKFGTLTFAAYDGGYYDQSHFIKDFKSFTGLSPGHFFAGNQALVRYFNLE